MSNLGQALAGGTYATLNASAVCRPRQATRVYCIISLLNSLPFSPSRPWTTSPHVSILTLCDVLPRRRHYGELDFDSSWSANYYGFVMTIVNLLSGSLFCSRSEKHEAEKSQCFEEISRPPD